MNKIKKNDISRPLALVTQKRPLEWERNLIKTNNIFGNVSRLCDVKAESSDESVRFCSDDNFPN